MYGRECFRHRAEQHVVQVGSFLKKMISKTEAVASDFMDVMTVDADSVDQASENLTPTSAMIGKKASSRGHANNKDVLGRAMEEAETSEEEEQEAARPEFIQQIRQKELDTGVSYVPRGLAPRAPTPPHLPHTTPITTFRQVPGGSKRTNW